MKAFSLSITGDGVTQCWGLCTYGYNDVQSGGYWVRYMAEEHGLGSQDKMYAKEGGKQKGKGVLGIRQPRCSNITTYCPSAEL